MVWILAQLKQNERRLSNFGILMGNTFFKKEDSKLITYQSGDKYD